MLLNMIYIFSRDNLEVNLTLLQFVYSGLNSSSCSYGGLTVYDIKENMYSEI